MADEPGEPQDPDGVRRLVHLQDISLRIHELLFVVDIHCVLQGEDFPSPVANYLSFLEFSGEVLRLSWRYDQQALGVLPRQGGRLRSRWMPERTVHPAGHNHDRETVLQ